MNKILNEIKEVLHRSPGRFSKVFFVADIKKISSFQILVQIKSTLDFFGDSVVANFDPGINSSVNFLYEERMMEKWLSTGLAIGLVENYLDTNGFNYSINFFIDSNQEINAEVLIDV